MRRIAAVALLAGVGTLGSACWSEEPGEGVGISTFGVTVTRVNGATPPLASAPLPANRGDHNDTWDFTVQAQAADGSPYDFNGVVRVTVEPGAVVSVSGPHTQGRNIQLINGKGSGTATVTAVYGPARLWIEDDGYVPVKPGQVPQCSNGKNDNPGTNVLIDYPADPGCAYADDNTEAGGTYAAGASQPVEYSLPRIIDVQGEAAQTPYPYDAIEVDTAAPQELVVTRVATGGFYVTDLHDQKIGYNHLYAFNFSTPTDMRVCDKVTYLSGTVSEFFGMTELNFPSYELAFPILGKDKCLVPEPAVLDPTTIVDPVGMEKQEAGLVRIQSGKLADGTTLTWRMPTLFGPGTVTKSSTGLYTPTANASSCDLNGDGEVDFTDTEEAACSNACDADPQCSEWTNFDARAEIKVHGDITSSTGVAMGTSLIQIDPSTATDFDPSANKGKVLEAVSGTLIEFSGGSLNWTIETRCTDDLVCQGHGCSPKTVSSQTACVALRTIDDNDDGTN